MPGPRRWDALPLSPWRWALLPAWVGYRPLVALRNAAFDRGWRRVHRVAVPVVSVGNLAVGGTGKTPLVAWLVDRLRVRGHAAAVAMRGYRGDGAANDEARMLGGAVLCDPDRVRGARAAIAGGATCVVLDDGFQHRRLHRDLDLVLIDATRPWGGGAVLPLGLLREGLRGLRRAHAVIVTRSDQATADELAAITARLLPLGVPIAYARHQPVSLTPLAGGAARAPAALAGVAVVLASGLGNPAGFERTARDLGWAVRATRRFPDHHRYDAADAAELAALAARHDAVLVVTAKDAVKLRGLALAAEVLTVAAALDPAGTEAIDALLAARCPPPARHSRGG
jgi:tetraacyldisaccharide 4'-kinase